MDTSKTALHKYANDLTEFGRKSEFVVFLCGPSITDFSKPGAVLRKRIKDDLEKEGFTVILGEDDGLDALRDEFNLNAQTNELSFIKNRCNAIILIASSVGAYCELGTFSEHLTKVDFPKIDFILLIEEKYKGH